jgi:hypothetical protein
MKTLPHILIALGLTVAGDAYSTRAGGQPEFDMLSPADAVGRAEAFISKNGYTCAEPDSSEFVSEIFEPGSSIEEVLRLRHNSLKRTAYGYTYGSGAIFVFFQHTNDHNENPQFVRVVRMRPDGSDIGVVHQGFMFLQSMVDQPDRCEIPPWFAEDGLLYPRPSLTKPVQPTRACGSRG